MSGNFDFATLGPVMSCPLSVRWVGMYWLIPLVIRYGKVVEPRSWMAERIAAAPKGSRDDGGTRLCRLSASPIRCVVSVHRSDFPAYPRRRSPSSMITTLSRRALD